MAQYLLHFEHDVLSASLYTHLGNITRLTWHHSTPRRHSGRRDEKLYLVDSPMPPKTPMCIRDEKEDVLREVQVPEQRQHGLIERTCKKRNNC